MSDAWNEDFTHAPKDRPIEIMRYDGRVVVDQWECFSPQDCGWIISAVSWREIKEAPDE